MESTKRYDWLAMTGAVLIFIGLIVQFSRLSWAPYIYIVGAVAFGSAQFITRYQGPNFVIRRLVNQQIMGIIALILSGVLMLVMHRNEWIVCLSVAAFIELYTVFRIDYELKKEQKKSQK